MSKMKSSHEGLKPADTFDPEKLSKIDKIYIVSRFLLMLHEDERFELVQRPLEKLLTIISDNDMFGMLENINLHEFLEVCEYTIGLNTKKLIDFIYETEARGINEPIKDKIEKVIKDARKKKKKGHKK